MTNNETNIAQPVEKTGDDVIDFGKIFRNYLRHWWLFLICMVLCLGLAFVYVKHKSPVYLIKGLIMLNQEEAGGMSGSGTLTSMMSLLGQASSTNYSNPENEIMKMESQTNLTNVVNDLNLQYNYWKSTGFFGRKVALYKNNPVAVNLPAQVLDTIGASTIFHIEKPANSKDFSVEVKQKGKKLLTTNISRFPGTIRTPYGSFTLTLTKDYNPMEEIDMYAGVFSTPATVDDLRLRLTLNYVSKKADAIYLDIEDVDKERGEDVLNAIMDHYNAWRLKDNQAHNRKSLDFIDARLLSLYNEIDEKDSQVENFKKQNRIVDAEAEAQYIFTRMGSIDEQYISYKTRAENFKLLRDVLTNPGTRDNQIPFTASDLAMSEAFGQSMVNYNKLLTDRMDIESTAKPGNKQLDVINRQIESTRKNILNAINREITNNNGILSRLQSEINERDSRLAGMPAMEHKLLSFERDRVVKNQIYAFLLQKREETQIALSQTELAGKVIDKAYPEIKPVAPKKGIVLGIAFVLGLLIPILLLQVMPSGNKKKD